MNPLKVWGDDWAGQLSAAPNGMFKAVAGGSINGLAIRQDGTAVIWGLAPNSVPLGTGAMPAELTGERFRDLAIGRDNAVLIRQDGGLAAFGGTREILDVPAGSYRDVTVAAVHAVAIRRDRTLEAGASASGSRPTERSGAGERRRGYQLMAPRRRGPSRSLRTGHSSGTAGTTSSMASASG